MLKKVTLSLIMSATAFYANAYTEFRNLYIDANVNVVEYGTENYKICAMSIGVDPMLALVKNNGKTELAAYSAGESAKEFEINIDGEQSRIFMGEPIELDDNDTLLNEMKLGQSIVIWTFSDNENNAINMGAYHLERISEAINVFRECN